MTSPFKFLDAFEQRDRAIFFGRSAEIEQLYRLLFEANLVLVYGSSGTGKTSLIQCGLANRFAETDWFQLFVRRNDDINVSLDREVRAKAITEIPPETSVVEAIRSLYLDHLRPIYLIFDQFEELFILGSKDEQERFFATVAAILASDVSCKIIISLREEYLASLHRFEEVVPALFNKRLRVEAMSMTNVEQVITGSTGALGIGLEHGKDTARLIIAQLDDNRVGVQLAYLQVYLDSLFNRAVAQAPGAPVVFTDAAVQATGKLGDIMAQFLEEQTAAIQASLTAQFPSLPKDAVQQLLEEFVTVDGTKQPTSRAELLARLPDIEPWLDAALAALQNARILRNVDDRYELAHDSLAGRICENRSGERKAMLMVQKIVRDRLAANPETKTWLSPEEIAVVNRSRRQVDTIRGTPLLELTPDENAFIDRSVSKERWRRVRRYAFWLSATALLVFGGVVTYVIYGLGLDDAAVAASSETDWLVYRTYTFLRDSNAPNAATLRRELLNSEAELNSRREAAVGMLEDTDSFWNDLRKVDMNREKGHDADARAQYERMAVAWQKAMTENAAELRPRVRLKAILWRLYDLADSDDASAAIMKRILDVTVHEDDDEATTAGFRNDIAEACGVLNGLKRPDERCQT